MSSGAAASWDDLARECDAWAAAGRVVELWWRDDDAISDTPALRQLLDLAAGRAPLALAVIPADLTPGLAAAIERAAPQGNAARGAAAQDAAAQGAGAQGVGAQGAGASPDGNPISVLQHGFDHANRAAAGAKKSEFPPERPATDVSAALAKGRDRLAAAFGARFVPVLTPPWNRFDTRHLSLLGGLGYRGLSAYLARRNQTAAPGLRQVNTHVDVIDWRGKRGFVGQSAALALLVGHLAAKRRGLADAGEPTGLLTHHLVHDTETWDFLGALLDWCATRPGVKWRSAADLFPEFYA